ncbi:MAG: histidinol dehydrogenase [Ruminococcaceae bacterium]|nr:histidinol dehydrogenase [Oscillospiraceae bacterium]
MIRILDLKNTPYDSIFSREEEKTDVSQAVAEIIQNVRQNGDRALFEYCKRFDKAELESLEVTNEELDEAEKEVGEEFMALLRRAAKNIRAFHQCQKRQSFFLNEQEGIVIGQKIIPIENAGLYVPGGTASYPSTVLMDSIPAKIAGVENMVMVSPPNSKGRISAPILAAARVAGVDRIFKLGGAQAIAALAYGTETVPKVDKIVGPGNAFVAEAKKQVFGQVSIDMIAGPSEILIVADKKSDAKVLAADLLSQAEHDKMASAVLVTESKELAEKVSLELERQIPLLERSDIARCSIDTNGKILICEDLEKAIETANKLAPEHLELCVDAPFDYLDKIKHAGSVFLGRYCPEALGDYYAGPNHTLPTGGTARFSSPLSVDDFIKKTQVTYYTKDALKKASADVFNFANAEGLTAHAKSAVVRFEDEDK